MSGSWGCPHEVDGLCQRLRGAICDPGMRGCVLDGKVEFTDGRAHVPRWPPKEGGGPPDAKIPRMELRAVLFDMDGVLVFSEDAWFSVFNETLVSFGRPPVSRAEFDAIYGNGAAADRDAYMPDRTVAEIDAAYARLFEEHLGEIRPNGEAKRVLAELRRRGVKTSVATNTTAPLARRVLALHGLLPLLDATASADEAGAGKPDPAVVRLAADRVGSPLAECLFVGDSRFDAAAAEAAPVRFVGLGHGGGSRIERLEELLGLPGLVA